MLVLLLMVLAGLTIIILKENLVIANMTVLLKAVLNSTLWLLLTNEPGLFEGFLSVSACLLPCSSPV